MTRAGRAALIIGHVAGMIDLVSLPIWVNALIKNLSLSEPAAGGLVTLFLIGVVAASLFWAPRFASGVGRQAAPLGYLVSALAFLGASLTTGYGGLAALSLVGGLATGTGLSFTHGTIGASANPHRLFGMAQFALGVFGIAFMGITPGAVASHGIAALYWVFAAIMAAAAITGGLAFPAPETRTAPQSSGRGAGLGAAVWLTIGGIMLMTLNQAMLFSFVEHIGLARGFSAAAVTGVLIAIGVVNLLPGPIAALLERRLSATGVAVTGVLLQGVLSLIITNATVFAVYAVPVPLMPAVMVFTHTFVFGLLARLDPTNRALAYTPAILMGGSALGPFLGGAVVHAAGFPALGFAIAAISLIGAALYARVWSRLRAPVPAAAT